MTGNFDTDDKGNQVVFMSYAHLTLEIWTGDGAVKKTGAINHLSLNTSDADAAYKAAKAAGFTMKETEVQHLDFWDHGIKFFNIEGPNAETIEFCQIVKG